MFQSFTLLDFAEKSKSNFDHFRTSFPDTFHAGENLNSLFAQLSEKLVIPKEGELWQQAILAMLFGCSSSWSHSLVATAAGLDEHGMTSIRRSIEFTCYIAKITRSKEKAAIWISRRDSKENQIRFASEFAIPKSFFADKYSHLKYLLVDYDHVSDFATHANLSMLASKSLDSGDSLVFSIFDDPTYVPVGVADKIEVGSWILECLLIDLKPLVNEYEVLKRQFDTSQGILRKAKIELKNYYTPDKLTPEIQQVMMTPNAFLDKKFEDLKRKYADKGR